MTIDINMYRQLLPTFLTNPDPSVYQSNNYVVLDFETTNIDKGDPNNFNNSLVLSVWAYGKDHEDYDGRLHVKWGTEYEVQELVEACEKADFIVAHNAKFELGWLERCGLNITTTLPYCTQIGEYVLAGNRKMRFSLEHSLSRWGLGGKLSVVSTLMDNGVCPSEMPPTLLERYGLQDVRQTHRMFLRQRAKVRRTGLLPTAFTRNIFTTALVEIQKNGMHLDRDRVLTVYRSMSAELALLQQQLDQLTGGINFNSNPQVAELLFKKLKFAIPTNHKGEPLLNKPNKDWPDGVPKVDKKTLAKLNIRTKKQREFMHLFTEVKKLDSSITKFIGKMAACVEETDDHVLHARMNQTTTSTHRLSSSGLHYKMQFQNFDRRFKPLFCPRHEGWYFAEADEAQLEYRTAVFLGDDAVGRADIANGVDAHSLTASIVFDDEWEACGGDRHSSEGKKIRTDSKEFTFKPLYGGRSGTDKQVAYFDFFMEKHKGIAEIQEVWIDEVYRTKQLTTITGMKFYWTDSHINRRGKLIRPDGRPADQSICNYPVQSLATAEIVPIAVTFLYHYMKAAKMESFLVNTVHDSALGEIHPDERELFDKFAVQSMVEEVVPYLKTVYGIDFDVPLEAEIDFNSHWANSKDWEEKYLKVA